MRSLRDLMDEAKARPEAITISDQEVAIVWQELDSLFFGCFSSLSAFETKVRDGRITLFDVPVRLAA